MNVLQKFVKFRKLEETSDQLVEKLPEIPRDLPKHKLHYVFKGIQKQANERPYVIEQAKDEANDADDENDDDDGENDEDGANKTIAHVQAIVHQAQHGHKNARTQTPHDHACRFSLPNSPAD